MDIFDRCGVKFVSVTQSLDTQNPMGRLLRNVLLDFAQFEREMTADRTRDKMHQRAQKGLWNGGNVPYGYVAENKKLVPQPREAPRLQYMFHRFADVPRFPGYGTSYIDGAGTRARTSRGARWLWTIFCEIPFTAV